MDPTSRVFALVLQHERHLSSDGTQNVNDGSVSMSSSIAHSAISMQRKSSTSGSKNLRVFIEGCKDIQWRNVIKSMILLHGVIRKVIQIMSSINQLDITETNTHGQVPCGSIHLVMLNHNLFLSLLLRGSISKQLALIQSPPPVNPPTSTVNALTSKFSIFPDMVHKISCSTLASIVLLVNRYRCY